MDKSVVGLLGGVSALALIGCAQSALAKPVLTLQPARSYAELLDPITNASELLREVNRRPGFVEAQFYSQDGQPYHHHIIIIIIIIITASTSALFPTRTITITTITTITISS